MDFEASFHCVLTFLKCKLWGQPPPLLEKVYISDFFFGPFLIRIFFFSFWSWLRGCTFGDFHQLGPLGRLGLGLLVTITCLCEDFDKSQQLLKFTLSLSVCFPKFLSPCTPRTLDILSVTDPLQCNVVFSSAAFFTHGSTIMLINSQTGSDISQSSNIIVKLKKIEKSEEKNRRKKGFKEHPRSKKFIYFVFLGIYFST